MPTHIKVTNYEPTRIIVSTNGSQWWGLDVGEGLTKIQLQRIAAGLAAALRQEGVKVAPVVVMEGELAAPLLSAVLNEIDITLDAFYDDPGSDYGSDPSIPAYVASLKSVEPTDGQIYLDADQALSVLSALQSQLVSAEDFEDPGWEPEPLRDCVRALQSVGYPLPLGPTWDQYEIQVVEPSDNPYEVRHLTGGLLSRVPTLDEAHELIREHHGPESQLKEGS